MKTIEEVKKDLNNIRVFYANKDVFDNDCEVAKLAEHYNSVMSLAPASLIAYYRYRYQYNLCNKVICSNFGYSPAHIDRVSYLLKSYLMERA